MFSVLVNFLSIDTLSLIKNADLRHLYMVRILYYYTTVSSPHEEILAWWRWSFLQHQACRRRYWGIWKKTFQYFDSKLKLDAAKRTAHLWITCVTRLLVDAGDDSLCDLLEVPHGISITCDLLIGFHYFLYLRKQDIHIQEAAETTFTKSLILESCFTSTLMK